MKVRAATRCELAYLQGRLAATDLEQVELGKSIVFLVEEDGSVLGFVAAQLTWRVEPLMVFPEFQKRAPAAVQRKAAYLLGRAIDNYIMAPERPPSLPRRYFATVKDKLFARLAIRFGMKRWPEDEILLERS